MGEAHRTGPTAPFRLGLASRTARQCRPASPQAVSSPRAIPTIAGLPMGIHPTRRLRATVTIRHRPMGLIEHRWGRWRAPPGTFEIRICKHRIRVVGLRRAARSMRRAAIRKAIHPTALSRAARPSRATMGHLRHPLVAAATSRCRHRRRDIPKRSRKNGQPTNRTRLRRHAWATAQRAVGDRLRLSRTTSPAPTSPPIDLEASRRAPPGTFESRICKRRRRTTTSCRPIRFPSGRTIQRARLPSWRTPWRGPRNTPLSICGWATLV